MLAPGGVWDENIEVCPPKGLGLLPDRPKEKGVGGRIEFGFSIGLKLDVMFNGIDVLAA